MSGWGQSFGRFFLTVPCLLGGGICPSTWKFENTYNSWYLNWLNKWSELPLRWQDCRWIPKVYCTSLCWKKFHFHLLSWVDCWRLRSSSWRARSVSLYEGNLPQLLSLLTIVLIGQHKNNNIIHPSPRTPHQNLHHYTTAPTYINKYLNEMNYDFVYLPPDFVWLWFLQIERESEEKKTEKKIQTMIDVYTRTWQARTLHTAHNERVIIRATKAPRKTG